MSDKQFIITIASTVAVVVFLFYLLISSSDVDDWTKSPYPGCVIHTHKYAHPFSTDHTTVSLYCKEKH